MRNQLVKSACVLAAIVATPGIAEAQDARAANAEILDTAREAGAAQRRSNCLRLGVMRNRLNDIRVDPNHPFWKRHGLDEDPAARERVMQNLTRSVTQLFSLDCSQPEPPKPQFAISGAFRYMDRFVGDRLGVGVVVTPGDPFLLKTPDRADGWSGHLNYRFSTDMWRHDIGLSYSETKASDSAVEPVGGRSIGYVPGDVALGAGVNFGAFGASATSEINQKNFTLDYKIMRDFNLGGSGFNWGWLPEENGERSEKQLGLLTTLRLRTLDHTGHLHRTPDPTNVFVDIDQSLDSTEFLIGPAVSGRHVYTWTGMYIGGSAALQAGFINSKLDSSETMCFACGGAPTTATINDSRTDFSWRALGMATVGYKKGNLDIGVDASTSYGTLHIIDTRQNPGDVSTHIGKTTGWDWGIGGHIRYAY
jgi:hypothetical protein